MIPARKVIRPSKGQSPFDVARANPDAFVRIEAPSTHEEFARAGRLSIVTHIEIKSRKR